MKIFRQIILFTLLWACCKENEHKKAESIENIITSKEIVDSAINDTILIGDMNCDAIIDTAFVYTPPTLTTLDSDGNVTYSLGCIDNICFNSVKFSCALPELTIANSVWGKVERIDDLNKDGIHEILFKTSWFTTTRSNLFLYSFNGSKWIVIEKVLIRDSEDESLLSHFVKTKEGVFLKGLQQVDGDEKEFYKRVKI